MPMTRPLAFVRFQIHWDTNRALSVKHPELRNRIVDRYQRYRRSQNQLKHADIIEPDDRTIEYVLRQIYLSDRRGKIRTELER